MALLEVGEIEVVTDGYAAEGKILDRGFWTIWRREKGNLKSNGLNIRKLGKEWFYSIKAKSESESESELIAKMQALDSFVLFTTLYKKIFWRLRKQRWECCNDI